MTIIHLRCRRALTWLALALSVPLAGVAAAGESASPAMKLILERYRESLINLDAIADRRKAEADLLNRLGDDGTWSDLDLSRGETAGFPGGVHLGRALDFLRQYAATGDAQWLDGAALALRGHIAAGPRSDNWWHNDIGMPLTAIAILTVGADDLPADVRDGVMAIIGEPLNREIAAHKGTFTGQNLMWRARIALIAGCLRDDAGQVGRAAESMLAEIAIEDQEGIQVDGSFRQHGPQIYSHGYGRGFTADTADLTRLLAGTPWQPADRQLDAIALSALGGQQWMMRGDKVDFHPTGREISRKGATSARRYVPAARDLARADEKRRDDYTRWAERMAGEADPLVGTKNYWRCDYFVHQSGQLYLSVRMASARTRMIECINGENVIGAALSAGCTCLMRTGEEYYDIFPLWNWTRLPGATSDAEVSLKNLAYGANGRGAFVGGVSNGRCGAAAMVWDRPIHAALTARKAWLCFDGGVVCLGGDIRGGDGPVYTGVQQSWLRGEVAVDGKVREPGDYSVTDGQVVSHHGLSYLFADGQDVKLTFGKRSGSWQRISESASAAEITGELFDLWIEHGTLDEPGSYAYTIVPAGGEATCPLRILRNDAACQAAVDASSGLVEAVFYEPGKLTVDELATIEVAQPCIVMLERSDKGMTLTASDPTQTLKTLTVTLNGRSRSLDLPTGMMAGSSVSRAWGTTEK